MRRTAPEPALRPVRTLRADAGGRGPGGLEEDVVRECAGDAIGLGNGAKAAVAPSCLVRPEPGDRVLVWRTGRDRIALAVLERRGSRVLAIATRGELSLEAARIAVRAEQVHFSAGELLTSAEAVHEVSRISTQSAELRVAEIGTDIRRARTARDEVEGTFVQRLGAWVSDTAREARVAARAMLFG